MIQEVVRERRGERTIEGGWDERERERRGNLAEEAITRRGRASASAGEKKRAKNVSGLRLHVGSKPVQVANSLQTRVSFPINL